MSRIFAFIFYAASALCVGIGLHKLLVYEPPSEIEKEVGLITDAVNAYVGGDAYNYIINASQATAYFVLAIGCFLVGSFILSYFRVQNQPNHK